MYPKLSRELLTRNLDLIPFETLYMTICTQHIAPGIQPIQHWSVCNITYALDHNSCVILLMLIFLAAFDVIDHNILLVVYSIFLVNLEQTRRWFVHIWLIGRNVSILDLFTPTICFWNMVFYRVPCLDQYFILFFSYPASEICKKHGIAYHC